VAIRGEIVMSNTDDKKGTMDIIISYDRVICTGKSNNSNYGIWHINRFRRVFNIEPTIRKRKLTNLEVKKVFLEL
jgi:hypothetical protein